jgi:hypothetical protein
MRRLALALTMLGAARCGDDSGSFEQAAIGISANMAGAAEGSVGCEKLPLLRGSQALSHYVVDDRFEVVVESNPESARVRFLKAATELAPTISVSRHDLELDFMQEVALEVGDLSYTVRLVSGCGS